MLSNKVDMNPVKRLRSNSESFEEETKKLRRAFDEKKTISCFESLPNELFYEIFDYLEGCKLYHAFSNLNARFQDLLTCSSLRLKIDLYFDTEKLLQHRSNHIVTSNRHRIISLSLLNLSDDDQILTLFTIDSSFNRLESLVLVNFKSDEFIPLLLGLTSLPCLFSLTINSDDDLEEISNVYQIIFSLSKLKYSKLSLISIEAHVPIPIVTNEQFSGIEYLVMDHSCALDELIALLSYTPRLCRLTCAELLEPHQHIAKESINMITSLTCISITRCYVDFDEFETFITQISSQLQLLRVTSCTDATYLDADRWEQIISQHLPHLHTFEFKHEEIIDEDLEVTPHHALINRFNSSFWIKRKWLFKLYIDTNDWMNGIVVYSIFPYREKWAKIYENDVSSGSETGQNTTQNSIIPNEHGITASSMLPSVTNQLTIINLPDIDSNESFFDIISSILDAVPITHLNITDDDIFIGTLIDLIQFLPNLDSLVVSSLLMTEPRCLSMEEAITLRLISNINEITKVKLQWMSDLAEVQFLIDLCPRMQYLEINYAPDVDPEQFVRYILMKNTKYIPHLCSLCLRISEKSKDMIEKLTHMIDFEQLNHNYTMKQVDDKIFLRWNLK